MGKHIIEEEAFIDSGFNLIKIQDGNEIVATNANRVLHIIGDGSIDIDVERNQLKLTTKVPVFKTLDW